MKHNEYKIELEKREGNIFDVHVEKYLNNIMSEAKDIDDAVETLRVWDKHSLIGRGGNHIWIADLKTCERQAIIYIL